jgi:hypothetical protein
MDVWERKNFKITKGSHYLKKFQLCFTNIQLIKNKILITIQIY